MRLLFALLPAALSAQTPCYQVVTYPGGHGVQWIGPIGPPTVTATVTNGAISLTCGAFISTPVLASSQCPGWTIPASTTPVYIGLLPGPSGGIWHVSGGYGAPPLCPATATNCYQDIFPSAGISEWPVATCTATACTSLWTGSAPLLPVVMGLGADGCTAVYSPEAITISCPTN